MIRYLRYLIIGLLGLSLLILALANREMVELRLLPADLAVLTGLAWAIRLPLFLVIFAGIVVGVLIGFVWEWLRETKHRTSASARAREVTRLKRELAVLQDATTVPKDDVLALLEKH